MMEKELTHLYSKDVDLSSWITNERPEDVPEGTMFDAWALRIKSPDEFASMTPREKLLYFSWFGSLAPTTHNTVPERFVLNNDMASIDIFIDRGTPDKPVVLPASDPVGRQASVSIGCVAQHMIVAAESYGISSELTINSENEPNILPPVSGDEQYIPVASLHFDLEKPVNEFNSQWIQAMLTRKSERKSYRDSIKIPPDILGELDSFAQQQEVTIHMLTSTFAKMTLGTFQSMADSFVVNNQKFSRELGDWLLPNDSVSPVGMRGSEFGFDDSTAEKYSKGLKGIIPLHVQDLIGFSLGGKSLMKDSSAIFVITVPEDNLTYRMKAGRVFDLSTLLLHFGGFSTSMHAGITEVDIANRAFSSGALHTHERPTVVFRAGRPLEETDSMRYHSSRPPIQDLILK